MPAMNVNRSVVIDASPEKIFPFLNDFNHWPSWSPWLIMEPGVKVTVSDDTKYYEWGGDRVGSGNMTVLTEDENKSINYDLTFLKPWKSTAKVGFILSPEGNSTKVTWTMDSSLPFFMFWMKKSMEAYVGMDYVRGLMMLKDLVEKGEVHSKLEFSGENDFKGTKYIGIKTSCSIKDVGDQMKADFGKIHDYVHGHQDIITGNAYSIYHEWDMVKQKTTYTGCMGVNSIPDNLPDGFISGEIPATKTYTLRHIGSYPHLGNAWSTLYTMQRGKEFKLKKGIHPFEHYVSNPMETDEKDLVTDVYFAIQ